MNIYLDHASTTPLCEAVKKTVVAHLDLYGNPSSMHSLGVASEKQIKQVRKKVATAIGAQEKEVIFTSGGTEANNLAIFGLVSSRKGRLITSTIEHPSVLNAFEALEKKGYELITIGVDECGFIDTHALEQALNAETILVSVMAVNNEAGTVQPVSEIGSLVAAFNKSHNTQIRFHVDAVQAFGKIPINFKSLSVDSMSISAHKLNALKGTGALVCKAGVSLKPLIVGGGQESSIRPGTENLLGIIALGEAVGEHSPNLNANYAHVAKIKAHFKEALAEMAEIKINGFDQIDNTMDPACCLASPYILNVSFIGVKGEVLLHALEMQGIYVATGSACSSKKKAHSHVLKALGLKESQLDSAIRFSFGHGTTLEELSQAAEIVKKVVSDLRSIMKNSKRR